MLTHKTVQGYVQGCDVSDMVQRILNTVKMSKHVVRECIDTYYHICQVKCEAAVPGNEQVIVGITFLDKDEPLSLLVYYAAFGTVHERSFDEMKVKAVSRMYVAEEILTAYGVELFFAEIIYGLSKSKADYLLKREKLVADLGKKNMKGKTKGNKPLNMSYKPKSKEIIYEEITKQKMERQFGSVFYWSELLSDFKVTNDLCRKLLPYNPPSLVKIQKTYREICDNRDIWEESYTSKKHSIVVEPFRVKQEVPPFVFIQSKYKKTATWDYSLEDILEMPIVVKNNILCKDKTLLCGILILYMAYPIRMQRETKRDAAALFSNILAQRALLIDA